MYINLLGLIGGGFVLDFGSIWLGFVEDFMLIDIFVGDVNVVGVWLIKSDFDLFVLIVVIGG